jgi:uncharacterized protein (AIM24 family)
MSQLGDVDVGCDLDCSCKTCLCAGLGCCRQKITGSDDSIAFLAAGGTIVYRHLKEDETITVDTDSIVAFEESVKLGIISNGKLCSITCCCGGEGIFSTTLTGPGRIYLQVSSEGYFRLVIVVLFAISLTWIFRSYLIFLQSYGFKRFAAAVQQTVMEDRGPAADINIS